MDRPPDFTVKITKGFYIRFINVYLRVVCEFLILSYANAEK